MLTTTILLVIVLAVLYHQGQQFLHIKEHIMSDTQDGLAQLRAIELRLKDELAAAGVREQKRDAGFKDFVGQVLGQMSALQTKLDAALAAAQPVDVSQDVQAMQDALTSAQSLGLETLADFGVTPAPPVTAPPSDTVPVDTAPASAPPVDTAPVPPQSDAPAAPPSVPDTITPPVDVAPAAPVAPPAPDAVPVVTTDGQAVQTADGAPVVATAPTDSTETALPVDAPVSQSDAG